MNRFIVIFTLVCALTGCSLSQPDPAAPLEQQAQPTPIPTTAASARPTYTVQRGTVEQNLEFSGRWLPRDQIPLSFEVDGKIRAVNVRAGDNVTAGEVLADYQIEDLEEQLADAQLQLETAQLNLQEDADGGGDQVTDAAYSLASANLDLQGQKDSLPWTSMANANAQIVTAQRNLEDAQRQYDEALGRADSSASAVDNARNGVISAQESLDSAWRSYYSAAQSYSSSVLGIERSENSQARAQQEYDDALMGVGVSASLIQSVRSAQLNVDQIKEDIARSTLLAPSDGVVLEVTIKPGDSASAYTTVITIGQLEPKELVVNMAYTDAAKLNVGMSGQCTPVSKPDLTVECVIRRLPLSNRDVDQSVRVAATFYDEEAAFSALINATMALDVRENVLWLPPEAIRTFQNRTFVVLDTPDGQQVVDISLGLQTDERVEIESGLSEGDVVIAPVSAYIECRQVVKAYNASGHEIVALRGVDFSMQRGEMTAIIGPSGAGKSSLMNLLGGLDRPTAGQVIVGDVRVPDLKGRKLADYRLRRVGFVWQQVERNLLAHRSALGNVTLPMMLAGVPVWRRRKLGLELLDSVGIADQARKNVSQLSGGQQQRVAIAVALANQPELLLADEPTGALDRRTARGVMTLLADLRQRFNLTVLMVTHDMDMAAQADRVLTLRDGALGQELSGEGDDGAQMNVDGSMPLPEAARLQLISAQRIAVEVRPEGVLLRPDNDDEDDIPSQDPLPPARRRWWRFRK